MRRAVQGGRRARRGSASRPASTAWGRPGPHRHPDRALEVGPQHQVRTGVGLGAHREPGRLGVQRLRRAEVRPRRSGPGPARNTPPATDSRADPYDASTSASNAPSTAVSTHGSAPGMATTNASQKVASSITPWTHQRSGTPSRSSYAGCAQAGGRMAARVGSAAVRRPRPARPRRSRSPSAPRPRPPAAGVRPSGRRRRRPARRPSTSPSRRVSARSSRPASRWRCPRATSRSCTRARGSPPATACPLVNTPGTVDAGYRGEIKVLLINHDPRDAVELRRGDRVAQLVVQRFERARFVEVDELPDSARGAGGYGSTGGFGPATDRRDTPVHLRKDAREVPPQGSRARPPRRRPGRPTDEPTDGGRAPAGSPGGPYDADDLDDTDGRVDLGALLLAAGRGHRPPAPGRRGVRQRPVGAVRRAPRARWS